MNAQAHTSFCNMIFFIHLKLIHLFLLPSFVLAGIICNLFQGLLLMQIFSSYNSIWTPLLLENVYNIPAWTGGCKNLFLTGIGLNLLHVSNLAPLNWKWWAFAFTIGLCLVLHLSWGGLVLCNFSFVGWEHPTESITSLNKCRRFESVVPEMQIWGIQSSVLAPQAIQNKTFSCMRSV